MRKRRKEKRIQLEFLHVLASREYHGRGVSSKRVVFIAPLDFTYSAEREEASICFISTSRTFPFVPNHVDDALTGYLIRK